MSFGVTESLLGGVLLTRCVLRTGESLLQYVAVLLLLNSRLLRAATTCWLLALQLNLLWVAALHRHQAEEASAPRAAAVRQSSQSPLPAIESGLLCTACQIVRHAAARPAPGATAPEARGSFFFLAALSLDVFHSHQPRARYGRAPPLA